MDQFGELPFHHLFIIHLHPTDPGCLDLVTPGAESLEHNWLIIPPEPGEWSTIIQVSIGSTPTPTRREITRSYFICIHKCNILYPLIAPACRQLNTFVVQSILANSVIHFLVYLWKIAKREKDNEFCTCWHALFMLTHSLNSVSLLLMFGVGLRKVIHDLSAVLSPTRSRASCQSICWNQPPYRIYCICCSNYIISRIIECLHKQFPFIVSIVINCLLYAFIAIDGRSSIYFRIGDDINTNIILILVFMFKDISLFCLASNCR